jgi:hypothetical protein
MRHLKLLLLTIFSATIFTAYGQQQPTNSIPADKKEIIDRFLIGKASPEKIAEMTRQIIANGPHGHLIIGADCSVPSPLDITANIHAAVSTAHGR